MSVVVYHKRLDTWLPGMHAGTFRGNQIGMVAGLATMKVIQRDGLASQAARHGELLMAGLRRIARDLPFLAEVRGRGLMVGVEVAYADSATRPAPADAALAKAIKKQCFEQGLILEAGGRHGAVLRFLPPLIISESEIGAVLDRFECSLKKVSEARQRRTAEATA
jgi:diaminobutyrate-2-oxoglutarate transaminase